MQKSRGEIISASTEKIYNHLARCHPPHDIVPPRREESTHMAWWAMQPGASDSSRCAGKVLFQWAGITALSSLTPANYARVAAVSSAGEALCKR